MKTYKYILFALATLSFVSCFEDESTGAVNPISEIIIDESSLEKVYNIAKNDTLIIAPKVSQTNEELPLSYTWELFQKNSSNAWESYPISDANNDTLYYKGEALGEFSGRLTVENEDGKAFFVFALNVNSPYEYGITVLSKDADNRPYVSFMQEPMKEGDERAFYDYDCLTVNNETQFFASNPSDIIQTTGTLIVACQGSDDENDNDGAAIYFLNEKTFVMENVIESKEYKTFKPTKLLTPQGSHETSAYPVLSADGKMYSLPTYNAVLQPSHNFLSTYAQVGFAVGDAVNNDIVVWDKEVNGLVCLWNLYGPYYCGSKYLLQRDSIYTDSEYNKSFKDLKGIRSLTYINKTEEKLKQSRPELIAIVEGTNLLQKVIIGTFFWQLTEGTAADYKITYNDKSKGFSAVAASNYPINENTPCIANDTYKTMLFANGNKVMRWNYLNGDYWLEDSDVLLSVGSSDEAIITSFEISDDHMKTYVAFYEPNQEGKNGSVWVFDTDTGEVLEKYDNVCYQPVKMIYKKK